MKTKQMKEYLRDCWFSVFWIKFLPQLVSLNLPCFPLSVALAMAYAVHVFVRQVTTISAFFIAQADSYDHCCWILKSLAGTPEVKWENSLAHTH